MKSEGKPCKVEYENMLNIDINPREARSQYLHKCVDPDGFDNEGHTLTPAQQIGVRSEVFIALWEMMNSIVKGTDWAKKTRIVLEYDPEESKCSLTTYRINSRNGEEA